MPTSQEWNLMIDRIGLDRFAALDAYENQFVELEGTFTGLGRDKKTGVPNVHAVMEDIYFTDSNGMKYKFSHMWLNKAAGSYFWNGAWYYNPIWYQIKENDFIKIRGLVQRYNDNKNKAVKYTLINVVVLSVKGSCIPLWQNCMKVNKDEVFYGKF